EGPSRADEMTEQLPGWEAEHCSRGQAGQDDRGGARAGILACQPEAKRGYHPPEPADGHPEEQPATRMTANAGATAARMFDRATRLLRMMITSRRSRPPAARMPIGAAMAALRPGMSTIRPAAPRLT